MHWYWDLTDGISPNFNKFNHTLFWGLQKPLRDSYNLSVISGLHIGPKLITASALDSMLSSLKVKVKGKVDPVIMSA